MSVRRISSLKVYLYDSFKKRKRVKFSLSMYEVLGGVQVYLLSFFASTMDRDYGQLQAPAPPRKKP